MLRDTFAVYKRHWKVLVPVTMVVLAPQAIGDALIGEVEVEGVKRPEDVLKLASIPVAVAVNLGGEALLSGIVAAFVIDWRRGGESSELRQILRGIPYGRLIAIDLLLALGTAAGLVLLVVPGVLVFTYLLIAPALIEIEHVTIRESIRRSITLVSGSFWRVLGFAVLVFAVTDGVVHLLESPVHGVEGEALFNLGVEAAIEPVVTVFTVVLALALIDLHEQEAEAAETPGLRHERTAIPGGLSFPLPSLVESSQRADPSSCAHEGSRTGARRTSGRTTPSST